MPRGMTGGRGGTPEGLVALEVQLAHLARLEDPANLTPDAVVYREMLAEVALVALVGHREPQRAQPKGRAHARKARPEPEAATA